MFQHKTEILECERRAKAQFRLMIEEAVSKLVKPCNGGLKSLERCFLCNDKRDSFSMFARDANNTKFKIVCFTSCCHRYTKHFYNN